MYNYQQITELFGAPLNTVPAQQSSFILKPWHVLTMGIGLFLLSKGVQKLMEEYGPQIKIREQIE